MFKILKNLKRFFLFFWIFKKTINGIKKSSVSKKEGFKVMDPNTISLPVVNNFLIGVLVILLFLIGNIFFVPQKTVEEMIHSVANIQFQGAAEHAVEAFKSLTVYQETIAKRDIFSPYMPAKKKVIIKETPPPPQPKVQKKPQLSELARNLKLVGISWGKSPKALIKSVRDNDTYFVREGQQIGVTGIRIKKIERDNVVIKYKDEEMEL